MIFFGPELFQRRQLSKSQAQHMILAGLLYHCLEEQAGNGPNQRPAQGSKKKVFEICKRTSLLKFHPFYSAKKYTEGYA